MHDNKLNHSVSFPVETPNSTHRAGESRLIPATLSKITECRLRTYCRPPAELLAGWDPRLDPLDTRHSRHMLGQHLHGDATATARIVSDDLCLSAVCRSCPSPLFAAVGTFITHVDGLLYRWGGSHPCRMPHFVKLEILK